MTVIDLVRARRATPGAVAEIECEQALAELSRAMFETFSESEVAPFATLADFAPVWIEALAGAAGELEVARKVGTVSTQQGEVLASSLLLVAAGSRAILRLLAGTVVLPEGTWSAVVAGIISEATARDGGALPNEP